MNPNQQPISHHNNHYFAPHPSDSAIHPPGTHPLPKSTNTLQNSTNALPNSTNTLQNSTNALPTNTLQDSTETSLYGFEIADYQNWIAQKDDSTGNGHATGPSQDNLAVYGGLSSPWNDTRSLQVLTNEVTMLVPDKTIATKQIPCEICKISCNSQNAYEKHIAGKKHNRNLRLLSNPTNNTLLAGPSNTNTKLEKVCTTCNVVCNSEDMYDKHIAGKKHVKKVALMSNNGIGPHIAPKKIKADQSKWCDVCKIKCNSKDMYIAHLAGKQHLKKSEKLSKPNIDAGAGISTSNTSQPSTNAIIGQQEKPGTEKPDLQKAPKMDIEMKKLKVIQGGAAEADVRVCTMCDVVCNSQTMFQSHIAGNKHTSMLRKQAEATSG